jgi:type II secretory pathway component PulF
VSNLVSVLEPIMVIILGVIVTFIVLGIFMPLPEMISAASSQAG